MENVSEDRAVVRVSAAVAAGTTDINCSSVRATGLGDITFHALFGTITATAVTSLKVQDSDDDSTFADNPNVAAVTVADTDDDSVKSIRVAKEHFQAGRPYVRLVVDRGTANAVLDGAIAVTRKMVAA